MVSENIKKERYFMPTYMKAKAAYETKANVHGTYLMKSKRL